MITKLRIKNFKSIADSGELEIRPLTFLMGPNSSGKSAIMQTLLLLRQTRDSRDITNPLAIHGTYMDFGSYHDLIFAHKIENQLSIDLAFKPILPMRHPNTREPLARDDMEIAFSSLFGYNRKTRQIFVERFSLSTVAGDASLAIQRSGRGRYVASLSFDDTRRQLNVQDIYKFYDFYPALPVMGESTLLNLAGQFSANLSFLLQSLFYIGPLREWPRRLYAASGEKPQDVGLKGERSVDVLWIQSRRKETREPLFEKLNRWMVQFDVASRVRLARVGTDNYCLIFVDPQSGLDINLADVGFGASQVFPIAVQGFYSEPGSLLLIEQPEIHLHPRAQATLADLLIAIVKEKKTLLVETHSEHLISRVQRRIAEGSLSNSDVALYYCEATPDGTKIREIAFNEMGQFETEGLPEGFFEEGYLESMEHMKAMVRRVQSV